VSFIFENILPWALPAALLGIWLFITPSKDENGNALRRKLKLVDFFPPLGVGFFILTLISSKFLSVVSDYSEGTTAIDGQASYPQFPVGEFGVYAVIAFLTGIFIAGEMSEDVRIGETNEGKQLLRLGMIAFMGIVTIFVPQVI
jgi:hypothetical protein